MAPACASARSSLKVKHIDSSLGIIRVEQGKGKKDRHVMLSPETPELLRAWWKVRTNKYDLGVPVEERWLFPGRRKGWHLTPRQVSRLFHETVEAAGIRKKLTLHTLRHSFATICSTVASISGRSRPCSDTRS
jgi:integrase/recombinase XerD